MSNPARLERARRAAIALALAVGFAFAAAPVAAQAAPVNLGTAGSFVVLGGQTVTNTGPSVLNGDLGVAPGTALTGFGLPAVVNGATHDNDGVANQAQADLTTAYNVAAGQALTSDLTGQNLGNRTLKGGAYKYTSSAQLTGVLALDAEGNPNAQFVFQIASTLTTASASSVVLVNGASPCNVFWQIGSSATLGTTTAFQGNLMALTSISLNNGATVRGRMLARNGQVSLINNVLDGSQCGTGLPAVLPPVLPPAVVPSILPPVVAPPGTTPGTGTTPGATPGRGRLTLVKRASRSTVRAGTTVRYTIKVTNTSAITVRGVVLCDSIPADMQYVTASRRAISFVRNRVCYRIGTLRGHRSAAVRITLLADLGARGIVTNNATARANNATTVRATRRVTVTPPLRRPPVSPPVTG